MAATTRPQFLTIELPPGPLGVGLLTASNGFAYVNSKANNNKDSPLELGDVFVSINGITLEGGVGAVKKCLQDFARGPRNLRVCRLQNVTSAVSSPVSVHPKPKEDADESKPPSKKTKTESKKPKRPVVYMVKLNLPQKLLRLIEQKQELIEQEEGLTEQEERNLSRELGATKIGKASSLERFLRKLQELQTYIPFATLKYIAIEHDHAAKVAEQAMHFLFKVWHVEGEWYDMDNERREKLKMRFPDGAIHTGESHFPGLVDVILHEEQHGYVYLARHRWDETARKILDDILHDPEVEFGLRYICQQMFCTKIGSAADLGSSRGSDYVWSTCFADWEYVAFEHDKMRAQEKQLHNSLKETSWSGVGEWFYTFYPEDVEAIFEKYNNPQRVNGEWKRAMEQGVVVDAESLGQWMEAGLITKDDMVDIAEFGALIK